MPRVPLYDDYQATPNVRPNPQFRGLQPFGSAPQTQDIAGKQAQNLGHAMQRAGGEMSRIAIDMAKQANQVRSADGMTQLVKVDTDLQTEALQLKGRNALDRPGGVSLAEEYSNKLQTAIDGISSTLGNDAQRRIFTQQAVQLKQNLYARLSAHEARQFDVYAEDSDKAKVDVALTRAGSLPADDNAFAQSLGAIQNAVVGQTQRAGGNSQMTGVRYRALADQAYYVRYTSWKQDNPTAALASFQANQAQIGPLMRERIGNEVFRAAEPQLAVMAKPWVLSAGTATVVSGAEPRGIRNNNPGNIVKTDETWQDEVPGEDPRYATFSTPEAGIRAMGKTLLTYQDAYSLDTVSDIVSRWAPATENDTASYVATVAKAMGVKPDANIDLHDPDTMGKMVRAMVRVENGKQPYTDAQIAAGVGAALGKSTLPTAPASPGSAASNWRDPDAKTGIGVIDSLPPDQRYRVFQLAHAQANQDMTQARASVQTRAQDATAEYLSQGVAQNPPGADDFVRAYGQDEGMRRYQALQDTEALGRNIQQVKTASDADQEKILVGAQPTPGQGFAVKQRDFEILQKAVQSVRTARRKDPIAYALQDPSYDFTPLGGFGLPGGGLGNVVPELAKRARVMDQVAQSYGTRPAIMSNAEAASFGNFLGSLQTEDKARVLGQIADATSPVAIQSLSAQLGDKNNTLAIAAMLSGHREVQNHWFGPDTQGADAALLYLQGLDSIDQKRAFINQTAETGIKAQIYQAIDGVYQTPQGRDAAAQAAIGVYAGLKAQGVDNVDRAVKIATGGITDYNGAKIAKPYDWTDGQFEDALSKAVPERVAAAGVPVVVGGRKVNAIDFAKLLPGARLKTYGQGTYLVMAGNDVVRTQDGAPYILKVAP